MKNIGVYANRCTAIAERRKIKKLGKTIHHQQIQNRQFCSTKRSSQAEKNHTTRHEIVKPNT